MKTMGAGSLGAAQLDIAHGQLAKLGMRKLADP